jgi:hypothetical protein
MQRELSLPTLLFLLEALAFRSSLAAAAAPMAAPSRRLALARDEQEQAASAKACEVREATTTDTTSDPVTVQDETQAERTCSNRVHEAGLRLALTRDEPEQEETGAKECEVRQAMTTDITTTNDPATEQGEAQAGRTGSNCAREAEMQARGILRRFIENTDAHIPVSDSTRAGLRFLSVSAMNRSRCVYALLLPAWPAEPVSITCLGGWTRN